MAMGLGLAVAPGIIMTPLSSLLEASVAHLNPEPLWRRATRGLTFRCGREIIFGIGLNQLTDYCEERTPTTLSKVFVCLQPQVSVICLVTLFLVYQPLRNAAGSMLAGMMSGYLSHVPHNLSTLKLMNPSKCA